MNIMVILDVQLWELGTQRLHQGLSETILVNTLTDVREFKNTSTITELYLHGTELDNSWCIYEILHLVVCHTYLYELIEYYSIVA